MSKARQLADLGNVYDDGALSNRNIVTNGSMQVAQRGTSFSGPNDYTIDRWKAHAIHPAYTVSQQTITNLAGFSKCVRVQRNSGTTNNAYSIEVSQAIEHLNAVSLIGKTVTLSFWARVGSDYAGDTGAFTSAIAYHNLTGVNFSQEFGDFLAGSTKVVQSNTPSTDWTYYTMTADIASNAYQVGITIATQSWAGTAGTNDYFEVTGVQLEVGDTATPFEHRSYGQELALCQRYGVKLLGEGSYSVAGVGRVDSSTSAIILVSLPVTGRVKPSITTSGNIALQGYSGSVSAISVNTGATTKKSVWLSVTHTGMTTGIATLLIANNDATASIFLDMEL